MPTLSTSPQTFTISSDAQVGAVIGVITVSPPITSTLNANFAVIGDSIARGTLTNNSSSFTMLSIAGVTIDLTYAVSGFCIHNSGGEITNGGGYSQFYTANKTCAVIWQRGTNDFGVINFSASTVYGELSTEVNKAKVAGLYTIVCTVLPRVDTNWDSTKEQNRLDYNNLVRANSVGADYIIDLTTNSQMGAVANASDTSKYLDGLHPTLAGQTNLNITYDPALRTILAQPPKSVTQTLGTLTLSGTLTAGAASTGNIYGATNGSAIASNVTGLTINSNARTYSYSGAGSAGTTASGLVETLSNATGSPKSSPITISAGAPSINYVRLPNLVRMTETAHGGTAGAYDYQSTGGDFGTPGLASSNVRVPAVDGEFFAIITNAPTSNGVLFGLSTNNGSMVSFSAVNYGMYCIGSGSPYHTWSIGSEPTPTNPMVCQNGDSLRALRVGTTQIDMQVQRSGSSTWTTFHSYTNVSPVSLMCCACAGDPTTGNLITTPYASSGVV